MMKPPMAKKGVKPSSTNVSLQSLTKPMTNPPTNVASHCSSKATLSPIPAWILPTSLCVCVCVCVCAGGGGQLLCKQYMTFIYAHGLVCIQGICCLINHCYNNYTSIYKSIPPTHTPTPPHTPTHPPHTLSPHPPTPTPPPHTHSPHTHSVSLVASSPLE